MANKVYNCMHCGTFVTADELSKEFFCNACGNLNNLTDSINSNYSENLIKADTLTLLRLAFTDEKNVNYKLVELAAEKGNSLAETLMTVKALETTDIKECEKVAATLTKLERQLGLGKSKSEKRLEYVFLYYIFAVFIYKTSDEAEENVITKLQEARNALKEIFFDKAMLFQEIQNVYNEAIAICEVAEDKLKAILNEKAKKKQKEQRLRAEEERRKAVAESLSYGPDMSLLGVVKEDTLYSDYRTGERLKRTYDGKIVNSQGEEVSPVWWE